MSNPRREGQPLSLRQAATLTLRAGIAMLEAAAAFQGMSPARVVAAAPVVEVTADATSAQKLTKCEPHAPVDGQVTGRLAVRVRRVGVPLVAEDVTHRFTVVGQSPEAQGVINVAHFQAGQTETMGHWVEKDGREDGEWRQFSGRASQNVNYPCQNGGTVSIEALMVAAERRRRQGGWVFPNSPNFFVPDGLGDIDTKTETGRPQPVAVPVPAQPAPTPVPKPAPTCPEGTVRAAVSTPDMLVCTPVPGKPPVTGN